jgi:hypothetical protein
VFFLIGFVNAKHFNYTFVYSLYKESIMKAITIHPESIEQLKTVKAVLKALKVPFEPQSISLPDHVTKSIHKGLDQYSRGESISLKAFKEKHLRKG